jgi:hemerythrin-like domain-containing protein
MSKPTGEKIDTWEMVVIHKMFRREFRQAAGLLRGVAAGDTARAEFVGDYLSMLATALHHHHHGEDELLWPKLLDRLGPLNADLVQRMESQHEIVASSLSRIETLLPQWRRQADAETRDELAAVYESVSPALEEHLGEEEREVLPLVSVHITQAEWDALGEHGKSGLPKGGKGFIALGAILEDATPTERDRFLGIIPAPVRLMHRLFGAGIHRRHQARLYSA